MLGQPEGFVPPADERLWLLTKGTKTAACWQSLHPLGLELRLEVDYEVRRTRVARTVDEARAESARWLDLMLMKCWALQGQEPKRHG